jgi:hypothetical protein
MAGGKLMGDRCSFSIEFPKKDLERFNRVLSAEMYNGQWWDEIDYDGSIMRVQIYEANYAWYEQCETLAKAGCTFMADHSEGGDYGSGSYACYEGDLQIVETNRDGYPCVGWTKDGPVKSDVEWMEKYFECVKKIEAYFEKIKKIEAN